MREISEIRNKIVRGERVAKQKAEKEKKKLERRLARKKAEKDNVKDLPDKQIPKTLENSRQYDETVILPQQDENELNFDNDEFASYFEGTSPKTIITTCRRASKETHLLANELAGVFWNAQSITRGPTHTMKLIIEEAISKSFTDLIVIGQHHKDPCSLTMIHLPHGPTAFFKLSSVRSAKSIRNHGNPTDHPPELIMNNFNTMLGVTVGRFLTSLFPQVPNFKGRQAVTFHNQRDFIFFRRHRYLFDSNDKVNIQELGPRFTLKLVALQKGTFDVKTGEYIWIRKKGMNTRKHFYL